MKKLSMEQMAAIKGGKFFGKEVTYNTDTCNLGYKTWHTDFFVFWFKFDFGSVPEAC